MTGWLDDRRQRKMSRRLTNGHIGGALDGIIDGELRGWIWNTDCPAKAGTIWCVGSAGQRAAFRPTYRQDEACAMFGIDGIRGFSVPADLLDGLGPVISVHDHHGRLLHNGSRVSIRVDPSEARREDGQQWLFVHIPKTAGTSLRNALLQTVSPGEALLVYPNWDLGVTYEECLQLPTLQLHRFQWIYGHYKTGLHRYATDRARYVTFIREPFARLRSNIAHHAAAGTIFSVDKISVRPSIFINNGLGEEFDNLMTRMIAGITPAEVGPGMMGECHVERAIENVRRHFAFVGRQEQATADCMTLQKLAGLEVTAPELANVTPSRCAYPANEMEAIDWPAICDRNRFDLLLYRRLLQLDLTSRILS
jgi:hypothetical protein